MRSRDLVEQLLRKRGVRPRLKRPHVRHLAVGGVRNRVCVILKADDAQQPVMVGRLFGGLNAQPFPIRIKCFRHSLYPHGGRDPIGRLMVHKVIWLRGEAQTPRPCMGLTPPVVTSGQFRCHRQRMALFATWPAIRLTAPILLLVVVPS